MIKMKIERDAFVSNVLNREVFRMRGSLKYCLDHLPPGSLGHYRTKAFPALQRALALGGEFVGCQFEVRSRSRPTCREIASSGEVRLATPSDRDRLLEISMMASDDRVWDGRWTNDRHFTIKEIADLYDQWVINGLAGRWDHTLVFDWGSQVAGFLGIRQNTLDLMATSPAYPFLVAESLVDHALSLPGCKSGIVARAALPAYLNCGATFTGVIYDVHFWK